MPNHHRIAIDSLVGSSLADVERELILETLQHCSANRTRAAKLLHISIRTMRNKLRDYASEGVEVPPPHEQRH